MNKQVTLYNWSSTVKPNGKIVLHGQVSGHSIYPEGSKITTSYIQDVYDDQNQVVVLTATGSKYRLGYVNSVHELQVPKARDLLVTKFQSRKEQVIA